MMRIYVAIIAFCLPLPGHAGLLLNCAFDQTCMGKTCETWPVASLYVDFIRTTDGTVVAFWFGDDRMLQGPKVTEDDAEDGLSMFPGLPVQPDTFVYGFGEWINAQEEPRRSISVNIDNQVLTVRPTSGGGAVLTSDPYRLDALFGLRRFVGDCETGTH